MQSLYLWLQLLKRVGDVYDRGFSKYKLLYCMPFTERVLFLNFVLKLIVVNIIIKIVRCGSMLFNQSLRLF
ncbi:Uncharacterised protein [Klebsiella oxytoca]|nr:Uncharacterised protein [Klebsiella oxytoca]